MMDQPGKGTLRCIVVTPEKALLDEEVDFVALPMYDGELGVLPGRAPLIGRLGYGELRIRRGKEKRRYFVDGGFVQIKAGVVSVLTPRAMKAEDIKVADAERALQSAQEPAKTPEAQEEKQKAQLRARAQLRLVKRISAEESPFGSIGAH